MTQAQTITLFGVPCADEADYLEKVQTRFMTPEFWSAVDFWSGDGQPVNTIQAKWVRPRHLYDLGHTEDMVVLYLYEGCIGTPLDQEGQPVEDPEDWDIPGVQLGLYHLVDELVETGAFKVLDTDSGKDWDEVYLEVLDVPAAPLPVRDAPKQDDLYVGPPRGVQAQNDL